MYKFNSKLVIRENDKSMFSLDKMEIYEFNEAGFNAIMIIKEAGYVGITYQEWSKKTKILPDFIGEDLVEFWNNLIQHNIIVEV